MWLLSLISFLLLGGYLLLSALRFGIPDMVSDTYYQLQKCTGSRIIPFNKPRNFGWLFTFVMLSVSFLMMICLLDSGKGIQCLAFIGCAGLAFVGVAPNYCDKDIYPVHKIGAIVAAIGCVGWCLSTNPIPTTLLLALCAFLCRKVHKHRWYWLEIAGFLNTFITYWVCLLT